MNLQLGGIQKTALLALAMRADETSRPAPRIHDQRAQEILHTLGVSFEDVARELGICVSTSVPLTQGCVSTSVFLTHASCQGPGTEWELSA